jgi:SP family facilitated glucose transporter-like MFS transporter 1
VITLVLCPESPRYLLGVKHDMNKAEKSLKHLRMTDDIGEEMAEIKHADESEKALPNVTFKDMVKERSLKIPLLIAMALMVAQQFSGINAVSPKL